MCGSRLSDFSVKDLLKCHSLRKWISVLVATDFTQVKRGKEMHAGDIYVRVRINYLKLLHEVLLRNAFLGSFM